MFTLLRNPAFRRGLVSSARATSSSYIAPPSPFLRNNKNSISKTIFTTTTNLTSPIQTSTRNTTTKMGADAFLEAIANRRSVYALKKESPISDKRIQEILATIIKHVPSSFNAQSTRVVFIAGAEHEKLWDLHKDVLKPIVPEAQWPSTDGKIDMYVHPLLNLQGDIY